MTSTPVVSIIVPVYNAEKFLHRCIDSILAQTYQDFELLLIDDGSKDSSGAICDEYAAQDARVRVFHKENGGVSSARNVGLDNARGEWITFVDSDDYTYPCWLENYDIEHNAEFDLICQGFETDRDFTDYYGVDNNTRHGFYFKGDIKEGLELLFDNNILGYPWCKAFKREIIKNNNLKFDISIKFKEDELFLFQYSVFANNIICTKKVGYFYEIPNWKAKYQSKEKERIKLDKQAIELLHTIGINKNSQLFNHYRGELTSSITSLFQKNPKFELVKLLRRVIKLDFNGNRVFKPLKHIIFYDRSYILSYLLLYIYLHLKPNHDFDPKNQHNSTDI